MSSKYINEQQRGFALYVLEQRAIPHITDGLKSAARRVLWIARNGDKFKSATLAGATLPLHPHAPPETSINTLAGFYINNIPLLTGFGAFGTLLNPNSFGAGRYTSVKVSNFTKDILFKDIEIIPMKDNYDMSLKEPEHFLPLIPIFLVNSSEGIAIGYASTILPRKLDEIIKQQINFLLNKPIKECLPKIFLGTNIQEGTGGIENRWNFSGKWNKLHSTAIQITELPYGISHEKYISFLMGLQEDDKIVDYDDASKDKIDITIKFKRAILNKLTNKAITKLLKLERSVTENMNLMCDDAIVAQTFAGSIEWFTEWRLKWYVDRYNRLLKLLQEQISRYKDILLAISKNVGGTAKKIISRSELKDYLELIGIVNLDYIADLPIYRFTEEERKKIEEKLKITLKQEKEYNDILNNEQLRKDIYISELNEILTNFKKGKYNV